jgi:hypothetical protein
MKTYMKKRTNKSSDWLQIGFRKSSDQIGTGGTENSLCPSIFKSVTLALKEQGDKQIVSLDGILDAQSAPQPSKGCVSLGQTVAKICYGVQAAGS